MARFTQYNNLFVSDLSQVSGFLRFPPPIKLTVTNITEILLKVVLNTITLPITKLSMETKARHIPVMET